MLSKVYITVRPSVCPIVRQLQRRAVGLRRAAGLLLSAQLAGHLSTAAIIGAQQQRCRSMAFRSKCGQCHVDSRVDETQHIDLYN